MLRWYGHDERRKNDKIVNKGLRGQKEVKEIWVDVFRGDKWE